MPAEVSVKPMTKEQVLEIAILAGKILLCSGAETSRVEDTMARLCYARGMDSVSVFCTPSVIIVSDEAEVGFTCMYRVTHRSTNMELVSEVNDISFRWQSWPYTYEETMAILEEKLERPTLSRSKMALASGVGSAAFAIMLAGSWADFGGAFIAGFIAMWVLKQLAPLRPSTFWETTMVGAVLAFVALITKKLVPACRLDMVIASAAMPFLPGMALTNGLRDYMAGDLMSGNARVSEALLLVGGLAVGLAVVLQLWNL